MSDREAIIVVLETTLKTVDAGIVRNAALGEMTDGRFCRLADGDIDLTEEFFNGPDGSVFEFTMSPAVMLALRVTDGSNVNTALDTGIGALAAAVDAAFDAGAFGELVTAVRVQSADFAPRELFGAPDHKGAEFTIEIDYWSASSAG